jgi:hypothetical protein
MLMQCIVLWPVQLYNIFRLYHKRHDSKKNFIAHESVFFIYSKQFTEKFLVLRIIERDIVKNVYCYSCTVALLSPGFNETWIFWTEFRKIIEYQILLKSVYWKLHCSMRTQKLTDGQTDRQTDVTKLIVAFSNFANASKNCDTKWGPDRAALESHDSSANDTGEFGYVC